MLTFLERLSPLPYGLPSLYSELLPVGPEAGRIVDDKKGFVKEKQLPV
jgi:hypothetical protein